jgi:cytochrome c oxidase subunit 2
MKLYGALLLSTCAACAGPQNVLNPASPQNRSINTLFWSMVAVGGVIWIGVSIVAIWAAVRGRPGPQEELTAPPEIHRETRGRLTRIVAGATAATVLILLAFLIYDFTVGRALAAHPDRTLTIEVIGRQWWWEVRYNDPDPSKIVVDANELHLPAGETVQLKLTSRDVIHSLWIPNIAGKRDLIPGYTSSLYLHPDRPGVYRAQCAEFCGHEHAKMALPVVVQTREQFFAWLEQQRTPAVEPTDAVTQHGKRVFLLAACSKCHAITGVEAYGTVGPNLTHVASRRTIGAGTLPNERGYLTSWIVDPQKIKPGVRMPPNPIPGPDLEALLAYLETLK